MTWIGQNSYRGCFVFLPVGVRIIVKNLKWNGLQIMTHKKSLSVTVQGRVMRFLFSPRLSL